MSKKDKSQDSDKKEKKAKQSEAGQESPEPKLQRLEIIMSQSIEEDFVTAFMKEDTGRMFTKLPMVMGRGVTDPKMGDAVWPQLNCNQSNHEGDLVDKIQEAYFKGADGIVINPGAYTHTSIALLDAIKATMLPAVEVHISKVEEREDFRQISFIRQAVKKTITGHGIKGYVEACDFLYGLLAH